MLASNRQQHSARTFEIRDAAGDLQALHDRWDDADGKRLAWRLPGRREYGLQGRRVDTLPLYGSERVAGWPADAWIIVSEGESDADALTRLDVPAVATVTGAATAPTVEALAPVAAGRRFVTWPDNDLDGLGHMAAVGANLYRAGASAVRSIAYTPTHASWPKGAGARDLIGNSEPLSGAMLISWLLESWSLPVGRPGPFIVVRPPRTRADNDTGSVSDALIARGVLNARPGRTVRCPAHDDLHASLSILQDDRRAICKSSSCPWSGRGVWAADIAAVPA